MYSSVFVWRTKAKKWEKYIIKLFLEWLIATATAATSVKSKCQSFTTNKNRFMILKLILSLFRRHTFFFKNSDHSGLFFAYFRLFHMTKSKYKLIKALFVCLELLAGGMEGTDESPEPWRAPPFWRQFLKPFCCWFLKWFLWIWPVFFINIASLPWSSWVPSRLG